MVTKCANAGCGNEFKRFYTGRLFAVHEVSREANDSPMGTRDESVSLFWICEDCATTLGPAAASLLPENHDYSLVN